MTDELHRELGPGHPLCGRSWRVIARALPNDDVVAVCDDDVAVVHLTWSRSGSELPQWPIATRVRTFEELDAYIATEFGDWEP